MPASAKPPRWQTLLAFAIIYFVWGSTFLAIRIGVREVPPFLFAAMRFFTAGLLLFVWTRARGTPFPRACEWASASLLGFMIFVLDYGSLFWAEKRVPSGVAAVMLALIPSFMALSEIIFLHTQKLTIRLGCAMLAGLAGVGVLVNSFISLGQTPIDLLGAGALVVASVSWSIAAILNRKLPLPESKVMSSSAQMLTGGFFLTITAALLGNFKGFSPRAVPVGVWIALAYLILAGSIVAFTAYVWLIHHESPTRVGTYAYVNPVIAVLLGYFFGGEALGARTVAGTILVLSSVIVITTAPRKDRTVAQMIEEPEPAEP
jgi:drug/metabolite transporter (DMT)-like permease